MRHALPAAPAALCCLLATTSARADPPSKSLQLTYTAKGPGASMCPDEAGLHKAVLEQLGRDPFRPDAPYRLTAAITASFNRHGREFTAALTIEDATGRVVWTENRLTTMAPCTTLVLAVGNAVAGWIHERPRAATPSSPAQQPTTPPTAAPTPVPPSPTAARPPAPPPNASARNRLELRMGLDALVNIGVTPSPSVGVGPVFELRPQRSLSIEVGMRAAWTPVASVLRSVPIRSVYLSGSAAPCARVAFFSGCAVLEAGVLRSQGTSGVRVATMNPAVIAVGIRARAEWSVTKWLSLNGFIELKAVLTVTRLFWIDVGDAAWTTPPASSSLGFGITMRPW